jgi:hypothetical protein
MTMTMDNYDEEDNDDDYDDDDDNNDDNECSLMRIQNCDYKASFDP